MNFLFIRKTNDENVLLRAFNTYFIINFTIGLIFIEIIFVVVQ